ncbi:MAG: DUF2269 domain-containing protein [Pseudomonadota bacterium]
MSLYFLLKFIHIIGACVLIGTGAGIAFFMAVAHRTKDPSTVAGVARIVVIADFVFTATAIVLQPITGVLLASQAGYSLLQGWIVASIALYVAIGLLWLPVVWIQLRMRNLATTAACAGMPLPEEYQTLFRRWLALGVPAFAFILIIVWLMIRRPELGFV